MALHALVDTIDGVAITYNIATGIVYTCKIRYTNADDIVYIKLRVQAIETPDIEGHHRIS
jgi:hypothetical protein